MCGTSFDSLSVSELHLLVLDSFVGKTSVDSLDFYQSTESLKNIVSVVDDSLFNKDEESESDCWDFDVDKSQMASPELSGLDFQEIYCRSIDVLIATVFRNPSILRNFVQSIIDDLDLFVFLFVEALQSKVLNAFPNSQALTLAVGAWNNSK